MANAIAWLNQTDTSQGRLLLAGLNTGGLCCCCYQLTKLKCRLAYRWLPREQYLSREPLTSLATPGLWMKLHVCQQVSAFFYYSYWMQRFCEMEINTLHIMDGPHRIQDNVTASPSAPAEGSRGRGQAVRQCSSPHTLFCPWSRHDPLQWLPLPALIAYDAFSAQGLSSRNATGKQGNQPLFPCKAQCNNETDWQQDVTPDRS